MSDVFLRFPEVRAKVPYSKSWLYLAISEGRFPGPIKVSGGGRASLWLSSEIDSWIRQQVESSRSSKQKEDGTVAGRPADIPPANAAASGLTRFSKPSPALRPSWELADPKTFKCKSPRSR